MVFFWFFKLLKQGVVVQRHLFCDRHYPITRFFCPSLRYIINKQCDDPAGVALLLVAENVFSINCVIFCLETGWSAETQRSWSTINRVNMTS